MIQLPVGERESVGLEDAAEPVQPKAYGRRGWQGALGTGAGLT